MSVTYIVNGQDVELNKEPTTSDIDEAAKSLGKETTTAIATKSKPITEGIVEGTLKPIARGLVESGAGSLDALEGLNKMLGIVKSGQIGVMGKLAQGARSALETEPELKRGDISGRVPGRISENITRLLGTGGQFEIAGVGNIVAGATTLGFAQGGESIQDKIKAAAINNLQIGGFKAISILPIVPRIFLGASAFGIPNMVSNPNDPTQQTADFITGAMVGGVSKNAVENTTPFKVESKPPKKITDIKSVKDLTNMSPSEVIRMGTSTVGETLKPVLAKAMSFMANVSEGQAKDLLDHPEFGDNKYVRNLEKEAIKTYDKVIKPLEQDTSNRVVLTDNLKKGVQDLNLFVESKSTPGPMDAMMKQITEQTGGRIPKEFLEEGGKVSKVPFGKEATARLTGLGDAEKSKFLSWVEELTSKDDLSFNRTNALIREMDSTSQLQKRYKQLSEIQKASQAPPSTQFVSIASTMRKLVSTELKSQYKQAGEAIDQFAQMANARSVNRTFNNTNPHLFRIFFFSLIARATGVPIPPGTELGILLGSAPKGQKAILRTAVGIGEAIKQSVNPNIKFSGQSKLERRIAQSKLTT